MTGVMFRYERVGQRRDRQYHPARKRKNTDQKVVS